MSKLIVTIPGIGYYSSALLMLSEIGDINRFPDSYHLCSYVGLVSTIHCSGGITYHGAITKTGSKHLRWIMIDRCVHTYMLISKNSNTKKFYTRLAKRKGNSKTVVAAASKLLKVVYWVMK